MYAGMKRGVCFSASFAGMCSSSQVAVFHAFVAGVLSRSRFLIFLCNSFLLCVCV